jgi:hypothetical protein
VHDGWWIRKGIEEVKYFEFDENTWKKGERFLTRGRFWKIWSKLEEKKENQQGVWCKTRDTKTSERRKTSGGVKEAASKEESRRGKKHKR